MAPEHHGTIVLYGLRGPLIVPPLCRKGRASRTALVNFSRLFMKYVSLLLGSIEEIIFTCRYLIYTNIPEIIKYDL